MKRTTERLSALESRQRPAGRDLSHLTDPELAALMDTRGEPDHLAAAAARLGVTVEHLAGRLRLE